ncbi:MAG TPA: AsmA family protein, partial [Steroidobacteraceae bacterium]|nr:AsmA family protein [Steroidobacteraceae bacterium]
MRRTALWCTASALAMLLLLAAVPLCIAVLIDGHHLRTPFVHFIAARLGRPVQVEGAIETQLLSATPRVVAQHVTIGNPPWVPPGVTAEIGQVTLVLERWPVFGGELEIHQLEVEDASLHLARDIEGRANWQSNPPHTPGAGGGPPLIHSLSVTRTRLELDDAPRHLKFTGVVSARDVPAAKGFVPWHLEGAGDLNGHAAVVALNGDPLSTVSHGRPYRFAFAERSSGSRLE